MIDYTSAAGSYDNTRSHSDQIIDRLFSAVQLRPNHAILDFGCGTGNYLARIEERYGCRCCGVEPNDAMRAKAESKAARIELVKGDHQGIPFPDNTFDFAFMTEVIHHVPDLPAMFSEILRVVKASGRLCVVTESHRQIEARFYNRYFPSLAEIEKDRYPDVDRIVKAAIGSGFQFLAADTAPAPPRLVTDQFLRNVAEKNWSMFRLLPDVEFNAGLRALEQARGQTFSAPAAGDTFLWFQKPRLPVA